MECSCCSNYVEARACLHMYDDKETTVEQSDQNEEATGIVLQDNEDESAAVIDGESTAPVKDHNATLSFLDRQ